MACKVSKSLIGRSVCYDGIIDSVNSELRTVEYT